MNICYSSYMGIRDLIDIYAGAQVPQEYLLDCDITLWVGINWEVALTFQLDRAG